MNKKYYAIEGSDGVGKSVIFEGLKEKLKNNIEYNFVKHPSPTVNNEYIKLNEKYNSIIENNIRMSIKEHILAFKIQRALVKLISGDMIKKIDDFLNNTDQKVLIYDRGLVSNMIYNYNRSRIHQDLLLQVLNKTEIVEGLYDKYDDIIRSYDLYSDPVKDILALSETIIISSNVNNIEKRTYSSKEEKKVKEILDKHASENIRTEQLVSSCNTLQDFTLLGKYHIIYNDVDFAEQTSLLGAHCRPDLVYRKTKNQLIQEVLEIIKL
jgi:hypothetical protein